MVALVTRASKGSPLTNAELDANFTSLSTAVDEGGGLAYLVKTSAYTTADGEGIIADTSAGPFTITLPLNPIIGDQVAVLDSSGSWATNNLTINGNGETIYGSATPLVCDLNNIAVQLIYDGTNWLVYTQMGAQTSIGVDSAYDVALNNGFVGTEQQWLDSLQGNVHDIVITKSAVENIQVTVNFTNRLDVGETIIGISAINETPTSVITISAQTFTSSTVSFYVTGGVQLQTFSIDVIINTTATTRVGRIYLLNT